MNDLLTYLASFFSYNIEKPLLFTQIHFWVFLLVVYAGFSFIITRRWRLTARNAYLFAVSLLFYYKTSGLFVLLLIFSTILGWLLGIGMDRSPSQPRRKLLMTIGVAINLLVLCYFKYAYFFTDIFNASFGTDYHIAIKIMLPVGISFYTFQNISYIVDVYRRKIAHVSNILDFGFYTSFFPQLVAGPILRADQFVPQLYKPFFLGRRQFGIAVFWILNGLVKKLILSDYLAVNFVDRVFDNPALYTPFENFSALLLYSLQVYADFSGYTDIAIGVAMLMGFYLPVNFNSPYKATNPTDFWRRWHMSLSRWLRDYLYIPLGGNRTSGVASYTILAVILLIAAFRLHSLPFTLAVVAVLLTVGLLWLFRPSHLDTMLLGGMWHGSSFNFITWGGLNGIGILVYKWWHRQGWLVQLEALAGATLLLQLARIIWGGPLLAMLHVGFLISFAIFTLLALLPQNARGTRRAQHVWSITLTFVFISFTRLFFRSGSNLDPAEANEQAWQTASMMVTQIGSHWNLAQIPDILGHYWMPFVVFAIGMAIHWLPERLKRRYRLTFASLPLWAIATIAVVTVVVVYQFITADLQPFIYFQF